MIVFDLRCGGGHVFEAWFGSTADYDAQGARGLIACPLCDDTHVSKAAMAPAVPAKGNRADAPPSPAQAKAWLARLAAKQAEVVATCDYVGPAFATEARAIHDGEAPARGIYGETTLSEARALLDDGVAVAPLPFRPRAAGDA